jgi:murein tripeptide amidase MpaA
LRGNHGADARERRLDIFLEGNMRRRTGVAFATLAALAVLAPAAQAAREPLNAYRVAPSAENKSALALAGYDMTEADHGRYLEIYGTARQVAALKREQGIRTRLVGKARAAAAQSAASLPPTGSDAGFNVWRRYDRVPNDGKEQYLELYDRLEGQSIVKKVKLGTTTLGRDIIALKVTKNAKARTDNTRPAVLYNAMQHAREWLAGETCKRTLLYFTQNYGKDTPDGRIVTPLVDSRELWFLCVNNPDGYEYTFTAGNRLWRKNMADNNGNGVYGELGDGVDLNRNHGTNWGRDNEGSSDDPTSETYRGTAPNSEPETKAYRKLWNRVDFKFLKNDHTASELLLYPQGFQQYTPTPDNPIFEALAGNDDQAAIADKTFNEDTGEWEITGGRFDPDLSSELYITNGDALDDAYRTKGILGFTPEGSTPDIPGVSGFEFQDVEADVEAEFQRHRLFAIDLAESADDPGNPVSHMGNTVKDFYVDRFADSYGNPQPVQVTAKRSLGDVQIRYRINGGAVKTADTREFRGGERYYQERGVVYHRLRGTVRGTQRGDEVEVWFTGGRKSSSHFTYTVRQRTGADVLVMADENYLGGVPAQDPDGPHYLTYYTDALDDLGVDYDIYDVDARGQRAPDPLGVLSHYDAVVWYTGDDYLTRLPNQMPGTGTARLAVENMIAVRDYLNEGGKLLYTGKNAGRQYAEGNEFRNFGFPEPTGTPGSAVGLNVLEPQFCNKNGVDADPAEPGVQGWPEFDRDDPTAADGCLAHNDDFLQYYLGAYIYASPGNTFDDEAGHPFPLTGTEGGPFEGLTWMFDETGANNQDASATFVVTSSILDPERYPLYADSRSAASWLRPGAAPFDPHSGSQYVAAGADSLAYKRFGKTLDLTGATAPSLNFKFSADLEDQWDFAALEVRDVTDDPNSDEWTTLPEADTDGAGPDTSLTALEDGELPGGDSCPEGLASGNDAPHPFLLHYLSPDCAPTGTTGVWNRFTGSTGGWTDWTADLSAYAGRKIDVRISIITDWGTLGLGAWVDDWSLTDGATQLESNDFEQPLDASWQIGPPPAGTDSPENGWTQQGAEFSEGGVVTTDDTVYTGFGFEGINESARSEFMRRTLVHLGVLADEPAAAPAAGGGQAAAPGVADTQTVAATKRSRAYAKLKAGKLRIDAKGRVHVRIAGAGDAGAVAKGRLRLATGGKQVGAARFSVRAGQTKKVSVKVATSARRAVARGTALKATLTAKGTDSSGASIAAHAAVRLTR